MSTRPGTLNIRAASSSRRIDGDGLEPRHGRKPLLVLANAGRAALIGLVPCLFGIADTVFVLYAVRSLAPSDAPD